MTNAEQARYWLNEAQTWLSRLARAEADYLASLSNRLSDEERQVRLHTSGKDNFGYQRAARKLEAAERRATMYALFALLDEAGS